MSCRKVSNQRFARAFRCGVLWLFYWKRVCCCRGILAATRASRRMICRALGAKGAMCFAAGVMQMPWFDLFIPPTACPVCPELQNQTGQQQHTENIEMSSLPSLPGQKTAMCDAEAENSMQPQRCLECLAWRNTPGLAWWCGTCAATGLPVGFRSVCSLPSQMMPAATAQGEVVWQ